MTVYSRFLGKGLAFPVSVDPDTGGLRQVTLEENIKSCVRMFFAVRTGERVLLENYGMPELLFENMDPGTTDAIEYHIIRGLSVYEPRIRVTRVYSRETTPSRPGELPGLSTVVAYIIKSTNQADEAVYQHPSEGLNG